MPFQKYIPVFQSSSLFHCLYTPDLHCLDETGSCTSGWTGQASVWMFKTSPLPYSDVFKKELGTLSGFKVKLSVLSLAVNHSSVEPDKFLMP